MKNDRDSLILGRGGGEQSVPGCEVAVWRHLGCGSICAATWGDRLCPCWGSLFCRTPGPAVATRWSCEDMELRGHLGCVGCQFCSREAVLGCWDEVSSRHKLGRVRAAARLPPPRARAACKCTSVSVCHHLLWQTGCWYLQTEVCHQNCWVSGS